MFSTDSFKYLKSLASKYRDNLPRPTTFDDEFIIYSETLVKGLNYNTHQKYYLEHALPDRENENAMTALILQDGYTSGDPYLLVRTTKDGRFLLEVHASFDHMIYPQKGNETSFPQLVKTLFDNPGFRRYFTIHTDRSLSDHHHFIRYEMPLRQLRSRNLVEYSIFIIGQAAPFMDAALKMQEESREAVAA